MFAIEDTPKAGAPAHMGHWLTDQSSLTLRLKAQCLHFEVKLLRQWQQPADSSGPGWNQNEPIWLREVLLCLDGEPWVYALTEVPLDTLNHCEVDFATLGTRPLGEILFGDTEVEPGSIEVVSYGVDSRPAMLAALNGQPVAETLWGRSRRFQLQGYPLRVNEVFLPLAVRRLR